MLKHSKSMGMIVLLMICLFFEERKMLTNITDCFEFQSIHLNLSEEYHLTQDIDCINITNFEPIGGATKNFTGTLEGNNHRIFQVKISNVSHDRVGIFAHAITSTIRNIIFESINITTNKSSGGSLFGAIENSNLYNIQLKSISIASANAISNLGGLAGESSLSFYRNITIESCQIDTPMATEVGGFLGYSLNDSFEDCHVVGFPSNSSRQIVSGKVNIGGFIGLLSTCPNCTLTRSGVVQGRITGETNVGAMIGNFSVNSNVNFSQIYAKERVVVECSNSSCGGLFGYLLNGIEFDSFSLSNSYSRSNVTGNGNRMGGLIGVIEFKSSSLNITNCFSSNYISQNFGNGACIGLISNNLTDYSSNFYFNNETNPSLVATGSNFSVNVVGENCQTLSNQIASFDSSIWGGNSLKSEYDYIPSVSICSSSPNDISSSLPLTVHPSFQGSQTDYSPTIDSSSTISTFLPSTEIPSTQQSTIAISTTPPSTTSLSTNSLSTTLPSTTPPSTNLPSTNLPSTTSPSTNLPSTTPPSTNFPSTNLPSTTSPSTNLPSTTPPSTIPPSSFSVSTNLPSSTSPTSQPTTISTNLNLTSSPTITSSNVSPSTLVPCIYNVPNCQNCDQSINFIEATNLIVSCVFEQNSWFWSFKSNSSGLTINSNLVLTNNIVIDSNLIIQSNSTVSISVSNSSIVVNGCVTIEGDLDVLVDFKVNSSQSYDLIKYNCSRSATLQGDINVVTDKNQNSCLNTKSKVTLSSISTTISPCKNCKKKNFEIHFFFILFFLFSPFLDVPIIVGVTLGVFFASVIVIAIIIYALKKNKTDLDERLDRLDVEMKKMNHKKEWNENETHKNENSNKWENFNN